MCGRFVSAASPDAIAAYFAANLPDRVLPANFNVAPTDEVYAVVQREECRAMETFRWGLVPSWAKDRKIAASMINVRAETIAEKPAFARLFASKRCIVPADGFYEWAATGLVGPKRKPLKQPYFIHRDSGEPLAMAGIRASWRDRAQPDSEWLATVGVITTTANTTMAPVHDRMPVFLPRSAWDAWLDPTVTDTAWLRALLVPAPPSLLTLRIVDSLVNDVRNNGAQLIEPAAPVGGEGTLFG